MADITIGISQCLMGDSVRYDGQQKYQPDLLVKLKQHFNLYVICPEVESGMSVPRPPVQQVEINGMIKVIGRDDVTLDVTQQLQDYTRHKIKHLPTLSGFVCKSRSPSCGLATTPLFNDTGRQLKHGHGVFIERLLEHFPELPIIDEQAADQAQVLKQFLTRVSDYYAAG